MRHEQVGKSARTVSLAIDLRRLAKQQPTPSDLCVGLLISGEIVGHLGVEINTLARPCHNRRPAIATPMAA